MLEAISVEQLFDYLLKNKTAHRKQLLKDIANGEALPTALNKAILLKNKAITDDDAWDSDLDYIDDIFGDPQIEDVDDWMEQAVYQQVDNPDAAEAVLDNIQKSEAQQDIDTANSKNRKYKNKNYNSPSITANTLDRILTAIKNDEQLSDEEKMDKALRLVYNFSTMRPGEPAPDMRLSQDRVWDNLALAGVLEAYHKSIPGTEKGSTPIMKGDPTFMEKDRTLSDRVPLDYISDKLIDDFGNEESIFTPTKASNTVYNVFVNSLLKDIAEGNAPDIDDLNHYILDTWQNRLKTMTYDEWEKALALENTKLDINQLINDIKQPLNLEVRHTGNELYDHILDGVRGKLKRLQDKGALGHNVDGMIKGFVNAYLAANDYSDMPEDALTPEDWAQFLPDNPVLRNKSQEEKADNKLNRWHAKDKDAYKAYLDEMAKKRTDIFEALDYKDERKEVKKNIYKLVAAKYKTLADDFFKARQDGDDETVQALADQLNYYRDILQFKDSKTGRYELNSWADRVLADRYRSKYGIAEREASEKDSKTLDSLLDSSRKLMFAPTKEYDDNGKLISRQETEWDQLGKDYITSIDKRYQDIKSDKAAGLMSGGHVTEIPTALLDTIPGDTRGRIIQGVEV